MNRIASGLLLSALSVSFPALAADQEISGSELLKLIEAGQAPLILDTRSSWEYNRGHVPGARHFPFWLSLIRADDLDHPREAAVVVYCSHGPRSSLARYALEKSGFQHVLYLQGHMSGWKKAGFQIEYSHIE